MSLDGVYFLKGRCCTDVMIKKGKGKNEGKHKTIWRNRHCR